MLDNNSLVVLAYLNIHFAKSDKTLQSPEVTIHGLDFKNVEESFRVLQNQGRITTTDKNYLGRITVTGIVD